MTTTPNQPNQEEGRDLKDDGGPAFPSVWWDRDSTGEQVARECYPGISLRQYYAGQALIGIISTPRQLTLNGEDVSIPGTTARAAVLYADALILELKK